MLECRRSIERRREGKYSINGNTEPQMINILDDKQEVKFSNKLLIHKYTLHTDQMIAVVEIRRQHEYTIHI